VTEARAFRPDNPHGLLLYDYGGSPCARRCRITLLEKRLAWDTQVVDLSRLEQRNPEYLAINPNGFVPTLAHGERVVYESNVITEYLDDVFPETPLYPDEPWELAQVKMWQSAEAAMAKDYRTLMYQRLMGPIVRLTRTLDQALTAARRSTEDPADLAWEERVWNLSVLTPEEERQHEDRLVKWLDLLDRRLEGRAFLVGERFSQAEISVYPRVAMYPYVQIHVTAERHPNAARWMKRLARRRSFARTLSPQDAGLTRLARTPVLPWLCRVLHEPEAERSPSERLRLAILKRLFERFTAEREVKTDAEAGQRGGIRRPATGRIAPGPARIKPWPAPSAEVLSWPLTLYDYEHSPHARRIRIVLTEKGLTWKTVEVDMHRMAHKAPDFLALNPNGELPVLQHGERVLYDSQLIAEYLDRLWCDAGLGLLPRDAYEAAQVRMWVALEAGTHKEFRPLFYLYVIRRELQALGIGLEQVADIVPSGVHPSYTDWLRDTLAGHPRFDTNEALAREIIRKKLDVLEAGLVGHEFLVGEALSLADLAWYTRIDTFDAIGIALAPERHPNVLRWHRSLAERPALSGSRGIGGRGVCPDAT
jgi:glutathione S-transferase